MVRRGVEAPSRLTMVAMGVVIRVRARLGIRSVRRGAVARSGDGAGMARLGVREEGLCRQRGGKDC